MSQLFNTIKTGELFVSHKMISEEQLDFALQKADCRLGEYLLKESLIDDTQLAMVLAEHYKLSFLKLDGFRLDTELFNILPVNQAMRMNILPVSMTEDELTVCVANLDDFNLEQKLESITNKQIRFVFGASKAIVRILNKGDSTAHLLNDLTQEFRPSLVKETADGQRKTIELAGADEEQAPIIRLINSIIMDAIKKRASDIHIEAFDQRINVKFRIDGVLFDATETLDVKFHSALITRLKVMAELDIAEKRVPQDGRFKLHVANSDIDFRVSILPTIYGEDVVIRVLDKKSFTGEQSGLSVEALGLDETSRKMFIRAIKEPYGMVLITGPTGSGKTTTLYAALMELYNGDEKIITIEDPVEYELDGIVQIPVNNKKELTFAKGLRSILRHDPDKIMVGEIRDTETAQIAVQSALTGHLVFSTVHANNSFDVISRFAHMGVDIYSFVSALNCVMAQRLLRRLCPGCKTEIKLDDEYLSDSGLEPDQYRDNVFYHGTGCEACNHTGYKGRMAVTELLPISEAIRELILNKHSQTEIRQQARKEGMMNLRENAITYALKGDTSLEEINRVTFVE